MHRLIWLLLALAPAAGAQLDLQLLPKLGVEAHFDYESVAASNGSGLPAGSGSAAQGEQIYLSQCVACHGLDGRLAGNALVGGEGTLSSTQALKTVGSYWPYATTVFDYIQRAMPYGNEKSLSDQEVYAVTAYVLHLNDLVAADVEVSAATLVEIQMPNRDGFRESPMR